MRKLEIIGEFPDTQFIMKFFSYYKFCIKMAVSPLLLLSFIKGKYFYLYIKEFDTKYILYIKLKLSIVLTSWLQQISINYYHFYWNRISLWTAINPLYTKSWLISSWRISIVKINEQGCCWNICGMLPHQTWAFRYGKQFFSVLVLKIYLKLPGNLIYKYINNKRILSNTIFTFFFNSIQFI